MHIKVKKHLSRKWQCSLERKSMTKDREISLTKYIKDAKRISFVVMLEIFTNKRFAGV